MATVKTTNIKLKKVGDIWTFPDSKHLSKIEISKDNRCYRISGIEDGTFCEVGVEHTQKDVVAWLKGYDQRHEAAIAKRQAEQFAYETALLDRLKKEKDLHTAYTMATTKVAPVVNTFSQAKFANNSKGITLGESIYLCELPQDRISDKHWDYNRWIVPKNWTIDKIFIKAVLTLTDDQYDQLASNLMNRIICAECGITNDMGGKDSTYVVDKSKYPNGTFFTNASSEEIKAWHRDSWFIVAAIIAPNRQTFYVDTQGDNVARYAAIVS